MNAAEIVSINGVQHVNFVDIGRLGAGTTVVLGSLAGSPPLLVFET